FDRNWSLIGVDCLMVMASNIASGKWSLHWQATIDDVLMEWQTEVSQLKPSGAIRLEALGGDVDVFDGRLWADRTPNGTVINFNLVANFGLGSFERLVGNVFKRKCEKMFRALMYKWKHELDSY